MVNLTIDGKQIQVPEGTTVLKAAQSAGIEIPTLCDHPELTPYGGCRLCVVEIEGARTLQTSCTLPVNEKMVVKTSTDKVRSARKFLLTMIFSDRNHFCPFCQTSGGDCELQNAAYDEDMTHWPIQPNWESYDVDASGEFFVLDNNRCILCRRCVRACAEMSGNFTLGFEERGAKSNLIADFGTPLGESTCVSCGSCVQVCPTGALIDRWSAYRGKDTQVDHNETICVGCSIGCGIDVLTRDNQLIRIEGNWEAPVNRGVLCKTGRFTPMADNRERLATPLIRKDGKLKVTTWDSAIAAASDQIKPLVGMKVDGLAALASTRLSAEALYSFKGLFADNIGSETVTSLEEGNATRYASTVAQTLGKPFECDLQQIEEADCILILGADLVSDHEVAGFFVKRTAAKETTLIVIDSVENQLSERANLSLTVDNGKIGDTISELSNILLKNDFANKEDTLSAIASLISSSENPVLVYGNTIPDTAAKSLVELAKIIGAENNDKFNMISMKGNANSVAASQYSLDAPFALGNNQVVYVALGDEKPSEQLIQKLEKAPYLIVQASYHSKLTAMADVVLPVQNWLEQDGTYINAEGKIQQAIHSLEPTSDVRSNDAVFQEFAKSLGFTVASDTSWKSGLLDRTSMVSIA
ncbi:MAG: molybdopterin-dependent oxidoreductase [Anaerolineaceae bacterium]|nr:molybdopterin-dependent oxidoreductase [Anaerolineaceae bacterium]